MSAKVYLPLSVSSLSSMGKQITFTQNSLFPERQIMTVKKNFFRSTLFWVTVSFFILFPSLPTAPPCPNLDSEQKIWVERARKRGWRELIKEKLFRNDRILHECKQQVGSTEVFFFFGTRKSLLFSWGFSLWVASVSGEDNQSKKKERNTGRIIWEPIIIINSFFRVSSNLPGPCLCPKLCPKSGIFYLQETIQIIMWKRLGEELPLELWEGCCCWTPYVTASPWRTLLAFP